MERFTVTHRGVPIGEVELPERRRWAGGPLEPLPGLEPLRAVLAAVARRDLALALLTLERDAAPDRALVPPELDAAFGAAAALEFALVDAGGLPVSTDVVRVADPGNGAMQVRAYFWRAGAPVPATRVSPPAGAGGFGPASG